MPVRTNKKRQAIIDVATTVFEDTGYEAASMAIISARVGGSKTTLYGYFGSKEELFGAVVAHAMEKRVQGALSLLDGEALTTAALKIFARRYLEETTKRDIVALFRMSVTTRRATGLGARLYLQGPRQFWLAVADRLDAWRVRGDLAFSSKQMAAFHFKGLLEAGVVEPLLFGCEPEVPYEEVSEAAVAAFLKLYGAGALGDLPASSPER